MSDRPHRSHYVVLDGLRGIAALAVVVMHVGQILVVPGLLPQAYLAVPFFFLLSGFVIAYAYEDGAMRDRRPAVFLWIRIERLYPLLLVGLVLGTAFLAARLLLGGGRPGAELLVGVIAALLMIPLPGGSGFPIVAPQWSLAIEMWGNMAHFFLRPVLRTRYLVLALVPLLAALVAVAWRDGGLVGSINPAGFLSFGFSYVLGIVFHRLNAAGRLPLGPSRAWLPALLLLAALVPPQQLGTHANAIRDLFCVVVVFPAVMLAALGARVGKACHAFADRLGRLSYPLYITHYPVLCFACFAALRAAPDLVTRWLLVVPIVAVAVIAAQLALVLFDEPVRNWARRRRLSAAERALVTT